jgi:hypothetical protein
MCRSVLVLGAAQLRLKTFGSFLGALATGWKLQRNLGGEAATPRSPCKPDNSVLCWSSSEMTMSRMSEISLAVSWDGDV